MPGRTITVAVLTAALLVSASGCWNQNELPEYAFVQAIGIDTLEDGNVMLTTLFYKPGDGGAAEGGAKASESGFVVRTKGETIFEAVRDITIHMGRKAQWSHMRIILLGEQAAREGRLQGLMDYFLRDHEPRETTNLVVTVGRAGPYLEQKSLIESTIGQQLREMNTAAHNFSGKTLAVDLLSAAIQLKSETGVAMLPYAFANRKPLGGLSVAGLAIFKQGRLVRKLSPQQTEFLLMMRNQYTQGIVEVTCKEDETKKNALEKVTATTSVRIVPTADTVAVRIHTDLLGGYGELRCLTIRTPQDEREESRRISALLEDEFRDTIRFMQKNKLDLLGIADRMYRTRPGLWMKWRKQWDRKFAEATFEVDIELKIVNSGMIIPKSY